MQNSVEPRLQPKTSYPTARSAGLKRLGVSASDAAHAGVAPAIEALGEAASPLHSILYRLEAVRKVTQWLDRQFASSPSSDHRANHRADHSDGHGSVVIPSYALHSWAQLIQKSAVALLQTELLPQLEVHGIQILDPDSASESQREYLHEYFQARIYPLLTPLAVDPGHPFPYISTNSLNLLVEVRRPYAGTRQDSMHAYARVKLPRACPTVVAAPVQEPGQTNSSAAQYGVATVGMRQFYWTSALVEHHIQELFTGIAVENVYLFRLLRMAEPNASLGNDSYAPRARNRPVARLDVEERMPSSVLGWLVRHLVVEPVRVLRYPYVASAASLPELIEHISRSPRMAASSDSRYLDKVNRTSVAA